MNVKLRRACFQFIQEFPATSIILLIVAVMKTGAYLLNLELTEISRIEASYRNMFLLIVSIFYQMNFLQFCSF